MKTSITTLALAILFVPAIASAQSSSQSPAWGGTPVIDSCMALEICANQPPAPRVGNPHCSSAMTNCMTAQEIRQEARREARREERREAVREARRAERRASQ